MYPSSSHLFKKCHRTYTLGLRDFFQLDDCLQRPVAEVAKIFEFVDFFNWKKIFKHVFKNKLAGIHFGLFFSRSSGRPWPFKTFQTEFIGLGRKQIKNSVLLTTLSLGPRNNIFSI
jgi:hypothetical protein